ncbi:hypothetical protein [Desulfosporosinus sp.]|uniref:hypothetical protein n=1 Tax=Desulfosporosinus sp. TaxID=157907 RepID=UPI0025C3B6B0|nr:hypothetical protein [Desulfosporosinus sp.]MBC2725534.1 hypothetical protein [Desulfosporosinus sp.]
MSQCGEKLVPSPRSVSFGAGGSARLYPTPKGIPLRITASAILSTGDYRTGDFRHWRLSCFSSHCWDI